MNVFILTEGSKQIGLGHITRCLSLCQAFEEKGILPEFIINGDETAEEFLKGERHKILDWTFNEGKALDYVKEADIVIIDSYLAEYDFYQNISKLVKVPVYIDDNKRLDYPGGIVVNGTLYAEEMGYKERKDVVYLLGSKYTALRKEFWEVPEKEIKGDLENVMITFGGDDSRNMTPKILKFLNQNYPALNKNVIIGGSFQDINKYEIEILKDSNTDLIYSPDAGGMKKAMLEADIAVSAGGQTLYELARVGVPTIAVAIADNQLYNVRGWQKAGFIYYAGWWETKNVIRNIGESLEHLRDYNSRKEKYQIGRGLISGKGSIEIVNYLFSRN